MPEYISNKKMDPFSILTYVLNGLSVFSCIVVLILYLCIKEVHSFPGELTMYLIASASIYNMTYLFPGNETHSTICQVQGVLSLCFDLCSLIWIGIIGCITYFSLNKVTAIQKKKKMLRIILYIVSIGPSLAFALLAYFLGTIQFFEDDNYCWFKFSKKGNYHYDNSIIVGILYYIIAWFIIFFNVYFMVALIMKIRTFQLEKTKIMKYTFKLIRYPLIQLISYTPTTIIGLVEMITNNAEIIPVWVLYIQLILESLCGFFYVVAFIYNREVIHAIAMAFYRLKTNPTQQQNFELKMDENESIAINYDDNSL